MPVKLNIQEQEEVGLKLKAKARQRFRLVSARRKADGNLVGQVTLLHDIDLGDPLDGVRLKSLDRHRRNKSVSKEHLATEEGDDDAVKEEEEMAGVGCLGRLRGVDTDSNINPNPNPSNPVRVTRRRGHCQGMTRLR